MDRLKKRHTEIDSKAEVTPQLELEADAAAERHGDVLFKAMLNAKPDEDSLRKREP
jgi:hypothetical protein